jgi:signal transduction histidine kinase
MSGNSTNPGDLLLILRRLAAERPRDARARVAQLLDERIADLSRLLILFGAPGEGRLRHIVANLVVEKGERVHAVPQIDEWLAVETDEFTKNALRHAIEATKDIRRPAILTDAATRPVDEHFVEAYRYAASRLSHRMRNALIEPQTSILRLTTVLSESRDPALQATTSKLIEQLSSAFRRVARLVEFDVEDDYFKMRDVAIFDWLTSMNFVYAQTYSAIDFKAVADVTSIGSRVYASDYLLNTVFWNLWTNAHQAVGDACQIKVYITVDGASLQLVIVDNGGGFSPEAREAAFVQPYSSAEPRLGHSGKGLLEVQDAVGRLHGKIEIIKQEHEYRIRIVFPRERL